MTTLTETDMRNAISSTWWVPLIQGIASILFGFLAFTRTGQTLAAMLLFLGIYWIINGIFAFTGRTTHSRGWQVVGGFLSIVAGAFALSHPFISGAFSAAFIAIFIGASALRRL